MCTLNNFPILPPDDHVTLCEKHGEFLSCPSELLEQNFTSLNINYPEITYSYDLVRCSASKESAKSAFLHHDDRLSQRLWRTWCAQGFMGIINEVSNLEVQTKQNAGWISKISSQLLSIVRFINSLHSSLFPHLSMSNENLISTFSLNSDWENCAVRYFAWHPHTEKFAVAFKDDSIRVYTVGRQDVVPTLKHRLQKGISMVAWRPFSASTLAVACFSCVLVWHVHPTSLATRPSTSSVQVFSQSGFCPVTSIAWDPTGGGLLASASPALSQIMIWDTYMERSTPLHRVRGGGVTRLNWSPDGSRLFSAHTSSVFRVWETQSWSSEKWSQLLGNVQAACWSPDGKTLLFSTSEEAIVYSLTFSSSSTDTVKNTVGGSKTAVARIDLTKIEVRRENDTFVQLGGLIHNMVWDPLGERLAIQFKEKTQNMIAIFQMRIYPTLELLPCGVICGKPNDFPCFMSFQPNFKDGALLSLIYSSGKVSHIPFFFLPRTSVGENPQFICREIG